LAVIPGKKIVKPGITGITQFYWILAFGNYFFNPVICNLELEREIFQNYFPLYYADFFDDEDDEEEEEDENNEDKHTGKGKDDQYSNNNGLGRAKAAK